MKYQPKRLRRLERVWLDHGRPMYFITICTLHRTKNLLANDAVHERTRQFLYNSASHYDWWAGRYVLMPDHLHLFARSGLDAVTLGAWIKALKAIVAEREFKWQRGYFDHVLRGHESQSEKWEYIRNNPVRAGLIGNADEWPFGGEIIWREGEDNTPPRRETRPTTTARESPAGTTGNVGPVSRPGGVLPSWSESADTFAANTPPHQETRPTTDAATAASVEITLQRHSLSGEVESLSDRVAIEAPLEIRIEGRSVAVVMRTPGHDRELAAGFLRTENLLQSADDIFEITQCGAPPSENVINVTLRDPSIFDPAKLTRHLFTSSSCGICSKASIEAVRQTFPPIVSSGKISPKILATLPDILRAHQKAFAQTGGLHACALFDFDGNLRALREDVGRHNALDKLIGRALLEKQLPLSDQLLLLSGRVSFEMMQKALAAGIPLVAAISAPTSLAVEFARMNKQTLIGFLRGETMNVYCGVERISML